MRAVANDAAALQVPKIRDFWICRPVKSGVAVTFAFNMLVKQVQHRARANLDVESTGTTPKPGARDSGSFSEGSRRQQNKPFQGKTVMITLT